MKTATSTAAIRRPGDWTRRQPDQRTRAGRVLLLEPDERLADGLCQALAGHGVQLVCVAEPLKALARIGLDHIDVAVVSATLDAGVLVAFIETVRAETTIPVLLASGPEHLDHLGPAVLAGARPLVSLPYEPEALLLGLQTLVPSTTPTPPMVVGALTIDSSGYSARWDGSLLRLSTLEFEILHRLAADVDRVVPRQCFFELFWPTSPHPEPLLVAAMSRLRRRLDHQGVPAATVQTIWGVGYQLESRYLRQPHR